MWDKLPLFSSVLAFLGTVAYMWAQRQFSFTKETLGGFVVLSLVFWPLERLVRRVLRSHRDQSKQAPKSGRSLDDSSGHT